MIKITDEEIEKIAKEYANTMSCKDWSSLSGPPEGFANGMKYLRDLLNKGVIHDTN